MTRSNIINWKETITQVELCTHE